AVTTLLARKLTEAIDFQMMPLAMKFAQPEARFAWKLAQLNWLAVAAMGAWLAIGMLVLRFTIEPLAFGGVLGVAARHGASGRLRHDQVAAARDSDHSWNDGPFSSAPGFCAGICGRAHADADHVGAGAGNRHVLWPRHRCADDAPAGHHDLRQAAARHPCASR